MKRNSNWIWKTYFLLYLLITSLTVTNFFSIDSQAHRYYHILIGYHSFFLIPYFLNLYSIFLNVLSCVAFYCFLYNKKLSSKKFWRHVLFWRIITDLLGRSYETKFLTTIYLDDIHIFLLLVITLLSITIPSYIALYRYTLMLNDHKSKNPISANNDFCF